VKVHQCTAVKIHQRKEDGGIWFWKGERGAALTSRLQSLETELLTQADSRYRRLPPLTADIGGWYSVGDQEKY